jgi:hypothetical protein
VKWLMGRIPPILTYLPAFCQAHLALAAAAILALPSGLSWRFFRRCLVFATRRPLPFSPALVSWSASST